MNEAALSQFDGRFVSTETGDYSHLLLAVFGMTAQVAAAILFLWLRKKLADPTRQVA
jgi:uncharacterized membrane protein YedE/YeeE